MSKINKFNEFDSDKFTNIKPTNEFFGGMIKDFFKNAKNQMSLKVSQKIGGAKEIDKAVEEYKKKVQPFIDQELQIEKDKITIKTGEIGDDEKEKQLKDFESQEQKIKAQKDAAKKTFNVKVNKITSDSKDDNIKYYANLKKAELAEQVLAQKLEVLQDAGGEKMEGDDEFKGYIEKIKQSGEKATAFTQKMFKRIGDSISGKGDDGAKFDFEAAKKDGDYTWSDSPYYKDGLKPGTEITYWSNDNFEEQGDEYNGTEATVSDEQDVPDSDNNIKVQTEANPDGFAISKGKVITTKADAEEKSKEGEEQDAEDNEEMAEMGGNEE